MLVKVLKFGSNWWARFGWDPRDRYRYTRHAAYFNSAGLLCGNKIRRHWIIPGLIRFNGAGDFDPKVPNHSVGRMFECTDLVFAFGGNRISFQKKAALSARPDYFLVALESDLSGAIELAGSAWKSESVRPIAVSSLGARQEALLLMQPLDWIRTKVGMWQLKTDPSLAQGAVLELVEEGVAALCDMPGTAS